MSKIHLTIDLLINVPDDEKATQKHVLQELLNKLYLGAEHYEDDVFSVEDLTLSSFVRYQS